MITTLFRLARRRRVAAHRAEPRDRRRMRGVVILGTISLAVSGGFVASAANADAHTPVYWVNCTGWGVSAAAYSVEEDNTYSITVDGVLYAAGSFTDRFSQSGTFPSGSGAHEISGYIYQNDDPNAQYSYTFDLNSGPCVTYVPVPDAPTASLPTCTTDGVLTVAPPGDHVSVTGGQSGDGPGDYTIVYTTDDGYAFPDGSTTKSYPITVWPKSGEGCPESPVAPTVTQPSCDGTTPVPGSFVPPPDTEAITYTVDGNVITATLASDNFVWDDDNLNGYVETSATTATYTVVYDTAPECTKTATPVEPTVIESECSGPGQHTDATLEIPSTTGVVYQIGGSGPDVSGKTLTEPVGTTVTVVASPAPGYQFDGDDQSKSYELTFSNPGDCLVSVAPVEPTLTQSKCGEGGSPSPAVLHIPAVEGVVYTIDGKVVSGDVEEQPGTQVTVIATPADGYRFEGDQARTYEETFDAPHCSVTVTPVEPTVTQRECDADHARATYTIPDIIGVVYTIDRQPQSPGTHDAMPGTSVQIAAEAQPGYVLTGDSEWTLTFKPKPHCHGTEGSHGGSPSGSPSGSSSGSPSGRPPGGGNLSWTGVRTAEIIAGGLAVLLLGIISLALGVARRGKRS